MKNHSAVAALIPSCIVPTLSTAADLGFYVGIEGGQGRTQLAMENDDGAFVRGPLLDTSSDRDDQTFGLYGGYTFTQHFAIELAYANLGTTSFTAVRDLPAPPFFFPAVTPSFRFAPAPLDDFAAYGVAYVVSAIAAIEQQQTRLESQALSLTLLGRYEISAAFSLFGRAGIAVHQMESDVSFWINGQPAVVIGGRDKERSGAAVLGLGVVWSFHPKWALRLQAQRHFALEEEEIYPVDRGDVTLLTGGIEYRF